MNKRNNSLVALPLVDKAIGNITFKAKKLGLSLAFGGIAAIDDNYLGDIDRVKYQVDPIALLVRANMQERLVSCRAMG